MSYYRSYNFQRPSFFGGIKFFPPIIKLLMILNVGVFLFSLFFGMFRIGEYPLQYLITILFALFPFESQHFGIWQLFTYMFMHGGFMHLLFNMFALWMFGMELENNWGSKRFLIYYLLCGIGAGISNLFIGPLFGQGGPTVGASGAVYGILLAYGMIFPNRSIYLYFFIPIKAKFFVLLFMGLELFAGITGTQDGIAHFAHLGGAAVGFILLMMDRRREGIENWWHHFRNLYVKSDKYSVPANKKSGQMSDARFFDIDQEKEKKELQERVDEILDKVSREGYQNLTEEEKRILFEASKKLN